MEGMFVQLPEPQIVLSSLRPLGRIHFTCAHELGHHWFGHSTHVDLEASDKPLLLADSGDEYQANAFASSMLMPKTAVQHGFVRRETNPAEASPRTMLAVAHWLGVGYTTLALHLERNLRLISQQRSNSLRKKTPKQIVASEVPGGHSGSTFVVDRAWTRRALDMQVGDLAIVDGEVAVSGSCVTTEATDTGTTLVHAAAPGAGHLNGGKGWSLDVRVSRHQFEGRSVFRHLEESPDDPT